MLLIGMGLAGFGSAQVFSVSVPLLTTNFPHQERGKILGINTAIVYIALSFGPFVSGILVSSFGWHSLFLVLLPITALTLCMAVAFIPKHQKNAELSTPFDGAGTIIYIIAASLVLIGISRISDGFYADVVLIIGISISVLFLWWESKHPDPVFPLKIFRENKLFRNSSIAALISYGSSFAVALLLSFYLQNVQNFSSIATGTILIAQPLIMAILTPFTGGLSDRVDPRILATIGMTLTAASLFAFSFLTSTTPLVVIIGILIVLGCGFSLFSSPNMNSIMSSVPDSQAGIASATAGSMRVFGQVVSMAAVMVVFATVLGSAVISAEIAELLLEALSMVFLALGSLCTIGIWFSYNRGKSDPQAQR
jgi:MFS family permease